jgi:hypothetical protein
MNWIIKSSTILLILALALSISAIAVMTASAADPPPPTYPPSIPAPSIPQFTVAYVDHSYDVPAKTTQTTDPYTGNTVTNTISGYHVKNYTIDVTIKNQPYPSTVNNGNTSIMQYGIQRKGHFEPDGNFVGVGMFEASSSAYTVVSLPTDDYPRNGTIDLRVCAYLGFHYNYFYGLLPMLGFANAPSGWSNAQSITLTESPSITPAPTQPPSTATAAPTALPTQSYGTTTPPPTAQSSTNSNNSFDAPQLNWLETGAFAALGLIIIGLAVLLVLSRRKIKALELKQNGV